MNEFFLRQCLNGKYNGKRGVFPFPLYLFTFCCLFLLIRFHLPVYLQVPRNLWENLFFSLGSILLIHLFYWLLHRNRKWLNTKCSPKEEKTPFIWFFSVCQKVKQCQRFDDLRSDGILEKSMCVNKRLMKVDKQKSPHRRNYLSEYVFEESQIIVNFIELNQTQQSKAKMETSFLNEYISVANSGFKIVMITIDRLSPNHSVLNVLRKRVR